MTGASTLVRTLVAAGTRRLFSLSGNQVLSVYDACIDYNVEIIHVRHEAAAVHMADAWGRLTGEPGVALVAAGAAHANTMGALAVAAAAESPVLLLSGHCPQRNLGQGGFQEMQQAQIAEPLTKASWTALTPEQLAEDIARAFRIAQQGRPGPVHVSLPADLLEATVAEDAGAPSPKLFAPEQQGLPTESANAILDGLSSAARPLVLVGPATTRSAARQALAALTAKTHLPVVGMESPRGINDPAAGNLAGILRQADTLLLLGKKLDYTLGFGATPPLASDSRLLIVDPEPSALEQVRRSIEPQSRRALLVQADPIAAINRLEKMADQRSWSARVWAEEVEAALKIRCEPTIRAADDSGRLHPWEVYNAVQSWLKDKSHPVFVSDGGEFGQWAQACIDSQHRVINGPSGAIGGGIPFALAARAAFPVATLVATVGDGTFGFHAMEFDTAVRHRLPFVMVVGNDAAWNAEKQQQARKYGPKRMYACDLLPTRYDRVVEALGGHGEHVETLDQLIPAMDRALASNLPACVNVTIRSVAAPLV